MQNQIEKYMTTNLITVGPYETAEQAYQTIKNNWIRHLPVVDDEGMVLGMVSDRDLLSANPTAEVRSLMTSPSKIVDINQGLDRVIDQMLESKISSCLIEEDGEVVGIVTSEDLLRVLRNHLDKPALRSVRTALYDYVIRYPLGAAAQTLSNAGI